MVPKSASKTDSKISSFNENPHHGKDTIDLQPIITNQESFIFICFESILVE
jgi:hypothetical protein